MNNQCLFVFPISSFLMFWYIALIFLVGQSTILYPMSWVWKNSLDDVNVVCYRSVVSATFIGIFFFSKWNPCKIHNFSKWVHYQNETWWKFFQKKEATYFRVFGPSIGEWDLRLSGHFFLWNTGYMFVDKILFPLYTALHAEWELKDPYIRQLRM